MDQIGVLELLHQARRAIAPDLGEGAPRPGGDNTPPGGDNTPPGGDNTPPAGGCDGDFSLGDVPFASDDTSQLGALCDGSPPRNCPRGDYIQHSDGNCYCLLACSELQGIRDGDNCNESGTWQCQTIVSSNGNNRATWCVPTAWNLCTAGGGDNGGGDNGGGDNGGGDNGGGPVCENEDGAPSGAPCTFSSDCCSDECTFEECE